MLYRVWMPLLLLAWTGAAAAQEAPKIVTSLSAEQARQLLKQRKLDVKATEDKDQVVFAFKKDGIPMALYVYGEKDIMMDAVFPPLPMQIINDWNVAVKWSRASLKREGKAMVSVLEWNLDLRPGVTDKALDHFLNSFEREAKNFQQLIQSATKPEPVYSRITPERLETLLKNLKIDYNKAPLKQIVGGFAYDFTAHQQRLVLSYLGEQELMLEAQFKEIPLEKANAFNLQRKFIRVAVQSAPNADAYTALKANLDLVGGVTDTIVQNFVLAFEEEVRGFAEFLKKLKED